MGPEFPLQRIRIDAGGLVASPPFSSGTPVPVYLSYGLEQFSASDAPSPGVDPTLIDLDKVEVVDTLPDNPLLDVIYLIPE